MCLNEDVLIFDILSDFKVIKIAFLLLLIFIGKIMHGRVISSNMRLSLTTF